MPRMTEREREREPLETKKENRCNLISTRSMPRGQMEPISLARATLIFLGFAQRVQNVLKEKD